MGSTSFFLDLGKEVKLKNPILPTRSGGVKFPHLYDVVMYKIILERNAPTSTDEVDVIVIACGFAGKLYYSIPVNLGKLRKICSSGKRCLVSENHPTVAGIQYIYHSILWYLAPGSD